MYIDHGSHVCQDRVTHHEEDECQVPGCVGHFVLCCHCAVETASLQILCFVLL